MTEDCWPTLEAAEELEEEDEPEEDDELEALTCRCNAGARPAHGFMSVAGRQDNIDESASSDRSSGSSGTHVVGELKCQGIRYACLALSLSPAGRRWRSRWRHRSSSSASGSTASSCGKARAVARCVWRMGARAQGVRMGVPAAWHTQVVGWVTGPEVCLGILGRGLQHMHHHYSLQPRLFKHMAR